MGKVYVSFEADSGEAIGRFELAPPQPGDVVEAIGSRWILGRVVEVPTENTGFRAFRAQLARLA